MNYKEILTNVINNGQPKAAVRFDSEGNAVPVENGTIGTFCEIFRHDMAEGFPLSGMRKLPFRSTCVELEGFIKGITSKKWYQDRKCGYWNEWANPKVVQKIIDEQWSPRYFDDTEGNNEDYNEFKKAVQKKEDDLGPVYGYQWRNFDQHYEDASIERKFYKNLGKYTTGNDFWDYHGAGCPSGELHGHVYGFDQLKSIVDKLKTNPYDRRMICSAWNPNQLDMMALPACHYSFTVVVYGNKLNLTWNQRSCDLILGVPQNIASYATLLLLLCKESGLEPGELVGKLEDCHIYDNLMPKALELNERDETKLPTVEIKSKDDGSFSIFEWEYSDIELTNYKPHSKINMGSVTV